MMIKQLHEQWTATWFDAKELFLEKDGEAYHVTSQAKSRRCQQRGPADVDAILKAVADSLASYGFPYESIRAAPITAAAGSGSGSTSSPATSSSSSGLSGKDIAAIVVVLLLAAAATAVIIFVVIRRRNQPSPKPQARTSLTAMRTLSGGELVRQPTLEMMERPSDVPFDARRTTPRIDEVQAL